MAKSPISGKREDVTPGRLPDVTPTLEGPQNFDFTLQAVVEMQRTLGELASKVDRLIDDVKEHGVKIDSLRLRWAWLAGVAVAAAALIGVIWTIAQAIPWEKILK